MAGEPAPLAAVQGAVMKQAAAKASNVDPALSTQSGAVQQDLAVMADQAKGYTAGVNQGTIDAQANRAAQARRLAIERQEAEAERARDAQLRAIQAQQDQIRAQADTADFERRRTAATQEAEQEPDLAKAQQVLLHAKMNRTPNFQAAFQGILGDGVTNSAEAVAILRNAQENGAEWAVGINPDTIQRYANAYFQALEGRAANLKRLNTPSRYRGQSGARPAVPTDSRGGSW